MPWGTRNVFLRSRCSLVAINRNGAARPLAVQSVLASSTARADFLIIAPTRIILHDDPRIPDLDSQSPANLFSVRFRGGLSSTRFIRRRQSGKQGSPGPIPRCYEENLILARPPRSAQPPARAGGAACLQATIPPVPGTPRVPNDTGFTGLLRWRLARRRDWIQHGQQPRNMLPTNRPKPLGSGLQDARVATAKTTRETTTNGSNTSGPPPATRAGAEHTASATDFRGSATNSRDADARSGAEAIPRRQ